MQRVRTLGSALLGLTMATIAAGSLLAGVAGAVPTQLPDPSATTTTTRATTPNTTPAPVAPAPTSSPTVPETKPTKSAPAPAPAPAAATPEARITPIIECTFVDSKTKLTSTVWGYLNRGSAVSVPIGELNRFDNPKAAKGQPEGDAGQTTEFKAGRDKNVFIITTEGDSTWTLTGEKATTPGDACKTNPVPVVSTGLGGLVALAVVTMVMSLVLFWRMRRPPS